MTLDRTIAPPSKRIEHINILKAEKTILENTIPLYTILAGEQPVFRLELIFEAGSRKETVQGASLFTSKMLSEGTSKHSATEISEFFDQYGAFIEISQTADRFSLMVYGLTEHLPKFLPILCEMITDSTIPADDLDMQKTIAAQNLKINLEKTSFLAGQIFREQLYGKTHPYGRSLTVDAIEKIKQEDVLSFYQKNIQHSPFKVFLSGNCGETELKLINDYLGKVIVNQSIKEDNSFDILKKSTEDILVEKAQNMQSSIRVGKVLFNRTNPDFFKFIVMNTLLGGFFGSRLMKNIREEKGYTYGISSVLMPYRESGYLVIGTDVKKEFTQQTLDEIRKEIVRLQTESVLEDELETTKNYMIGSFVGSLNTPFEIADRQKVVILDNLPADFYENYIHHIRSVSAADVMEMANKYLQLNTLCEVVVGGK